MTPTRGPERSEAFEEALAPFRIAVDEWRAGLTPAQRAKSDFHSFIAVQAVLYGEVRDHDEAKRLLEDAVMELLKERSESRPA